MQQLHLVGFTTELDGLIFSARRGAKSGGYVVALDERFLNLVREAVRRQTGADVAAVGEPGEPGQRPAPTLSRVVSALSPKEIQARLRAGRSISEVAAEAGVDEEWVLRFATPILAEQAQVIERALTLRCRAPRKGESAEPLAAAVVWNLFDRGLRFTADEIGAGWSAYHVRDAVWVIRLRYVSRGRAQVAQWEYDSGAATLHSLNRLGSELGYLAAGRRRRLPSALEALAVTDIGPRPVRRPVEPPPVARPATPAAALQPPAEPEAAAGAAPTSAHKRLGARKVANRVAKKAPAKTAASSRGVSRRVAPKKKVAAKKVAAKKVAAKKVAAKKVAPRKVAPRKVGVKKVAAKKVAPKKVAARKVVRTNAAPSRTVRRAAPNAAAAGAPSPARAPRPLRVRSVPVVASDPNGRPPVRRPRPLVAVRRVEARRDVPLRSVPGAGDAEVVIKAWRAGE